MTRLGIICDPDFPNQVADNLAARLPDDLPQHLGDDESYSVEVVRDPLAAGRRTSEDILAATSRYREDRGWDYAVCLTDLPLRFDGRPVLADVGIAHQVGVISLPALGGMRPNLRARQTLLHILRDITGRPQPNPEDRSRLPRSLSSIRRESLDRDHIGVRYRATRKQGRLRLLTGMVRSNTPWRLVLGMSSALAAALATSAFGMVSSVVWQIGDLLSPWRKILVTVAVLALMVGWIIIAYRLWERSRNARDREQALLYNTSTVLTLSIGVGCLYLGLLGANFAAGLLLINPTLMVSKLGHPVGLIDYLQLAWTATSMGVAAGALGSGLEDDATVRQAAYGYREAQRRAQHSTDPDR